MEMNTRCRVLALVDTQKVSGPAKGLLQLSASFGSSAIDFQLGYFRYSENEVSEFEKAAAAKSAFLVPFRQGFHLHPGPLAAIFKYCRKNNVHLLQTHGYKTHLVGALLAPLLQIPWISVSHGWTSENRKVLAYNWLERKLVPRADFSVVVSPTLEKEVATLRKRDKETRTVLIENALSKQATSTQIVESSKESFISAKSFTVGVIGRLSPEKGQRDLLAAIALLQGQIPNVHVLFIGDGPERSRLEGDIQHLSLEGNATVLGYREHAAALIPAFDLLAIPSRSEGLPNVLLEAMAAETPVLATRVGAIPGVIEDGVSGFLTPPNSPQEMAQNLLRVYTQRGRFPEITAAAKNALFPRFSPERRAMDFIQLYKRAIAEARV